MANDLEEEIKDIEKYISFTGKRENFRHDTDWYWNKDLASKMGHVLSDYKKLQEEFKQVDHKCDRLEKKEVGLEKEIAKLKELMKHKIVYTKELEKDLFENASNYVVPKETIKDKLEELKIECEKMRPYKDVSPHDFGYINGKIDMLAELLKDDEK